MNSVATNANNQPEPDMPVNLQQSVLAMLLFDSANYLTVRNLIPKNTWTTDPAALALVDSVYDFIDRYGKNPGDHTYDLIKNLSVSPDQKQLLESLAVSLEVKQQGQNAKYVLRCISSFHRQSALRSMINKCIPLMDDPTKLDEIESYVNEGMKNRLESFEPGEMLEETLQELNLDSGVSVLDDYINTGIKEFDLNGIKPERQCLYIIMALSGEGKSWHLIEVGKQALLENKKVLHVTLELTSRQVRTRYIQNIFSVGVKQATIAKRLIVDERTIDGLDVVTNETVKTIEDRYAHIQKRLSTDQIWKNLRVKEFPMNGLTVKQLRSYIETLEMQYGFCPDAIIIDYPDLFKIMNPAAKREEISQIFKDLRGLAQEMNKFMIVATQSNRSGTGGKRLEAQHTSEDFSKYQTSDVFITYYKTVFEKQNSIGRVFAAKSRNSIDSIEVIITQNFSVGQFVLNSALLTEPRQKKLDELSGANEDKKKKKQP